MQPIAIVAYERNYQNTSKVLPWLFWIYPIQLSFNKPRKIYKEGDQQVVLEPFGSFVIINGYSPVPELLAIGTVVPPKTKAQKLARINELKAKSTLLLFIPDEHLLKFYSIKDAKSLWEAIKISFGGNKESKKMHKTILKQQYENFVASRSEGLDKTYDTFQKLISQLELNGEVISQEYANMKLLRSLPPAWNNIALIMRNKPDIETLSMDALYNNIKVYEAKIKGQSSLGFNSHNVAFVSFENNSSINETVTTAHDIPVVGSKEQPSASSYVDDIDTDDLEEMDLKWQVAMITMRVKKFMKRIRRNLNFNGKEPVGFDKIKVECYNFHIRGHFARECRATRNQGKRSAGNERRVVPVETPASALVVHDGLGGYDWSYQVEEGLQTFQMSANDKTSLGYDSQLSKNEMPKCEIFETEFDSSVSEIDENNNQEKDRYKVRIGYHAVPPPYIGNYMPPRADVSFAGLYDYVFKFKISETRTSVNKNESIASESSEEIREEPKTVRLSAPIIEDWVSDSEDECEDKTLNEQEISSNDNSVKSVEKVAIKSEQVMVNAAKQNSAASTSTTRPKDQGIFYIGCSRNMTGNKLALFLLKTVLKEATIDESNLWHRILGHINFKTLNKLVRGNLVRDHLGKFDGKVDEGFLVGYSVNSKAFRVFNSRTRRVEENMHVNFLENKPNVAGSGPEWLFDIDSLTKSMNYEPVSTGNQSNGVAGDVNAGEHPGDVNAGDIQGDVDEISINDYICQGNEIRIDSGTHAVNAASTSINTASNIIAAGSLNINIADSNHTNMSTLEATGIFDGAFDNRDLGAEDDTNNVDSSTVFSPIPTTRVHKDHPKEQIIGYPTLNIQTRRMINFSKETAM
nr:hypothetical protein [Tanacetum cinerariifolium]